MFSKACTYAIKATIFISKNGSKEKCVRVKEIAAGTDAPEYFIAKILQDLNKKRFIISVKGPNGGFYMTEEQKLEPLERIVVEFDGNDLLTACILGFRECTSKNPCPLHNEFQSIRVSLKAMLKQNSISDFTSMLALNTAVLKLKEK